MGTTNMSGLLEKINIWEKVKVKKSWKWIQP
jgi:hypothetical protein